MRGVHVDPPGPPRRPSQLTLTEHLLHTWLSCGPFSSSSSWNPLTTLQGRMGKLRLREAMGLSQGHTAGMLWSLSLTPGSLIGVQYPTPVFGGLQVECGSWVHPWGHPAREGGEASGPGQGSLQEARGDWRAPGGRRMRRGMPGMELSVPGQPAGVQEGLMSQIERGLLTAFPSSICVVSPG